MSDDDYDDLDARVRDLERDNDRLRGIVDELASTVHGLERQVQDLVDES